MKANYISFSRALFITILMIGLLISEFSNAQDWFDTGWEFRRKITIDNPGGTELLNYQVRIDLDNSSFDFTDALSDGSDIRITDSDKISIIPFWIETWDDVGEQGTIWANVPNIPIAGTSVYVYYGNPTPSIIPNPIEGPPIGPFTKSPSNPIVPLGDTGNGEGLLAENIVYDATSEHYWMVFAIYRGTASTGLAWSDTPNDPDSWNWHGSVIPNSNAPHLMEYNGTWYIFYADRAHGGPPYPISVATSPTVDGTYTYQGIVLESNPDPLKTWDDYRVDEPYVFQRNDGKWIMIYMGDAGSTVEQVGYAIADDILGPYTKFADNPCLAFGSPGTYDAGTIADPWVVEFNGIYYIGYTVSPTISSPWQTALATTTDWVTFTKHGILLPLAGEYNSFRGAVTRIDDEYVFSYTTKITSSGPYQMGIATQPVLFDPSDYIDNPEAVFDFYDGFDGTSIDGSKWEFTFGNSSQANVAGGLLTLTSPTASQYVKIQGQSSFGMDYIGETYGYHPNQGTANLIAEVGFADASWNTVRIVDDFPSITHWQREAKLSGPAVNLVDMAVTADSDWHTFRIFRQSPDIAGFQIDNTAIETTTTDVPTSALPLFLMSYGAGNQFMLDWTRVRKFAATDPTLSVGGEQIQLSPINISYTKSDVSDCYGGSDGAIDITVTGGTGSYTYLWSPGGEITEDITGLSAGIYSVVVTDTYDNTATFEDIEITQPDELVLDYTITNPITCSECTATVLISASGGTAPYTGVGNFEQGVGTVIYTALDDNGCSADISVTINEPAPWYNDVWQYRREVAITNTVGAILTEYQVMVSLDNSFDFNNANNDGSDIRVTTDDGTTLIPFWIESWNPAGQQASIWVRIPSIPVEGTSIYVYYGNPNPSIDTPVPEEVPPAGPFTRDVNNPINPIGDPGGGASLLAENIVYDDVTGHYWMVFANYRGGTPGVGLVWSDTPTDATSWHWHGNVYTHTSGGSFAPHIIKEDGLWYIFFARWPDVVYITSSTIDGTYSAPTIVLSPTETWEAYRVDEPYVFLRNDGKWIMIYMADAGSTTEQVGYASADDIEGPYTKYAGNPCLAFGPPGSFDAGTIADPWVYEYYGVYYIGYTVSPTKNSPWQTALATTTDWDNFTKQGVIFPIASSGWDAVNSFRGAVTRIGDEYVFSYTGDSYRMGIATQPVFLAPMSAINNAEAVFDFYDGFEGTALDGTKWTFQSGTSSQSSVGGGSLTLTHTGGTFPAIISQLTFGMNYLFETYARHPEQGTLNMVVEMGFNTNFGDVVRIVDDFPETLPSPTTYWNRQSKLDSQSGDPGWQPMAQNADQDWHVFHIGRQGTGIAGFQVDNNTMETVSSYVPTTNLPVFLMSYTESAANQLIVDWTRVRKWAGPDPITEVGIEQNKSILINVAIYNTTCGDFEVKLKPNAAIDNTLTNIQFTIKWPESTVNLTDFSSTFGVALQGSVVVDAGMNYAVFVSSASIPIAWDAGIEYTVLSFSHDHSSTGYANFEIDEGTWAAANNGEYYVELLGLDYTGIVYDNAPNVYLGMCGDIKVMLQAPYSGSGLMSMGLAGNIPLDQPYNASPWNYTGTENLPTIDASVVDWILVELRSDPNTTVEKKAALLLEDGSIVQYNNISQGVHFDNSVYGSSYYIVVHHRNHMPVMTLNSTLFNGTLVDFTNETICYGTPNAEIELETGVYGMIAGDINSDGYLSYSGPGNDRGLILARIVTELTTTNINDIAYGYFDEDVMMDFSVKYIGDDNDRAIMLTNLADLTGTVYLNAVYNSEVPFVTNKSKIINNGPIHIFLAETENEIQVKITTDEIIQNGIVDNVQFTLSWEVEANKILAPILINLQSTFGLMPQGEATILEGKMHQVFVSVLPVELPNPLEINEEVILASFTKNKPVTIGSSIEIAKNSYTENHNGDYYVSLLGTDFTGTIKTTTLGLTELDNVGLSIYPNPVTSGIVNVDMNLDKAQEVTILVLDIQGKVIKSEKLRIIEGFSNNRIDLHNLTKGIYYIKVQADGLNSIKKIIKM